jgi:hypothetical protein
VGVPDLAGVGALDSAAAVLAAAVVVADGPVVGDSRGRIPVNSQALWAVHGDRFTVPR